MLPKPNKNKFAQNYCMSNSTEQFGVRRRHTTEQQVLRLVEHAAQELNQNQKQAVVFLDAAKAFVRIWHNQLRHKMKTDVYPGCLSLLNDS